MKVVAHLQHSEIDARRLLAMIPEKTLRRLRHEDPSPKICAYVIAHEGTAKAKVLGRGTMAMQYFRKAIEKIHERLVLGTKIFHRHNQDSSHEGRQEIGELCGKALEYLEGKLQNIAAVYIRPDFAKLPLDVASIEAEVMLTDDGSGQLTAVDVGEITGIALSNSIVEKPGFSGATLLGAIQAFTEGNGGGKMATVEEIKSAVVTLGLTPSTLFGEEQLKADTLVKTIIRGEKQTEYEHAKRVEVKLAQEREDAQKKEAEWEKQVQEAKAKVVQGQSRTVLDSLVSERKLTDKQKAFVNRNFDMFTTEAKDASAVSSDLNRFLDAQLKDFADLSKMLGSEETPSPGNLPAMSAPNGDDNPYLTADGKDLTDPKNNPFIPNEG